MTSESQHLVAVVWAVLLGLVFLGGIGWWWVNPRRRRRRTPDLGILTALQERETERTIHNLTRDQVKAAPEYKEGLDACIRTATSRPDIGPHVCN
jgi:hypothetical protein